jgi:hypothetical protein
MPRNSAKPKLATIEVLIPPRPSGWENVPLLSYNSCSDESVGVDIDCEDVTSNSSSGEAETGPIKLLPQARVMLIEALDTFEETTNRGGRKREQQHSREQEDL